MELMDINKKPSVISLFCGAGSSSLGYQLSGFHELLGIDIDSILCQTFQHNFSLTPIWNRDLTTVETGEVLQCLDLGVGQLRSSSPPCQGFSICGTRNVQDKRNDPFSATTRPTPKGWLLAPNPL
jgi:DNA (cytosine-5)-methyltransferase 1